METYANVRKFQFFLAVILCGFPSFQISTRGRRQTWKSADTLSGLIKSPDETSPFSVIQCKRHQGARSNHRWHSFHSPSRRYLHRFPALPFVGTSTVGTRHAPIPTVTRPNRHAGKERVARKLYISNMIAKFHSAPGHSMETMLTINIPPPERIRAAKGERLREKQKDNKTEVVQGASGRINDDETTMREKEEERLRKDDREREREKLERERRVSSILSVRICLMSFSGTWRERPVVQGQVSLSDNPPAVY